MKSNHISVVMPGLVPGIHVLPFLRAKDVDGRDKPAMTKEKGMPSKTEQIA